MRDAVLTPCRYSEGEQKQVDGPGVDQKKGVLAERTETVQNTALLHASAALGHGARRRRCCGGRWSCAQARVASEFEKMINDAAVAPARIRLSVWSGACAGQLRFAHRLNICQAPPLPLPQKRRGVGRGSDPPCSVCCKGVRVHPASDLIKATTPITCCNVLCKFSVRPTSPRTSFVGK
jgi:hypothetical protein